ncbi:hypothetical protein [Streptomyces sp. NPDC001165]|uniref:hypothetical protein n=1 Tax=Streptomyces sp. NPDC001165 TaxID=3364546 RepID=UPI0036BE648B
MSVLITAGQRGDSPQFEPVLEAIRVPRLGRGRPRQRPDRVQADKAYDSRRNRAYLKAVLVHCPELDALTGHVRSFGQMLTERQGERLPQWLDAVRQDDLPGLHTLAAGNDRDRDAVIAAPPCLGVKRVLLYS